MSSLGLQTDAPAGAVRGWRALHAYVHADRSAVDRYLTGCVAPAVWSLLDGGRATSWFFIRYWHGGPHVRVRVRDATTEDVDGLADELARGLEEVPAGAILDPASFHGRFGDPPDQARRRGWHGHGEIVPMAYEPEVARYGGPGSIERAEGVFRVSSEVAMAGLGATTVEQRRLVLATDLLLGTARIVGGSDAGAIRWLRWYVYSWKRVTESGRADEAAARAAAETEFDRKHDRWIERDASVVAALDGGGGTLHRRWWDEVAGSIGWLRSRSDTLTSPVELVTASQAHMLHNRLGLTITDEMYIAWLASLVLAAGGPQVDFFTDGSSAPDRRYLETSKFTRRGFARDGLGARPTEPRRPWATGDPVTLPSPRRRLDASLETVLKQRRSRLGRFSGAMRLDDLGTLLAHAAGASGTREVETPSGTWEHAARAFPSAGASYGSFVRVVARNVRGLDPGLYEHAPLDGELVPVGPAPSDADLAGASPYLRGREGDAPLIDVTEAPALVLVGGALSTVRGRYGLRALRFLLLELGHLSQNLVLVATALGWETTTIGGLYDDAVHQFAQLDGHDELVAYLIPISTSIKDSR